MYSHPNTIDSPTYVLDKDIEHSFTKYTGNILSYNPREPEYLLLSFDATSLFTEVSITDSVAIIYQLLAQLIPSLERTKLDEKYHTSAYFTFQGQQSSGAAMDSSLSPSVTNIFMEVFELFERPDLRPKI